MSTTLTPRTRDFVEAVSRLTRANGGLPPTLAELSRELKLHPSRCAVLAKVAADRGAIERKPRLARAIRVIEGACKE